MAPSSRVPVSPAAADGVMSGNFLDTFGLLRPNIGTQSELASDVADSFHPHPLAAVSGMRYQLTSSKQLTLVSST